MRQNTLVKVLAGMCPKSLVLVSITPATVYGSSISTTAHCCLMKVTH